MGLLTKLTTDGSTLSINDGLTPSTNPLVVGTVGGGASIHSDGTPGNSYSLNGSNASAIGALFSQYEDGQNNPLPLLAQNGSALDLNGLTPTGPLNAGTIPINNSFAGGAYLNNLPEVGLIGDTNIATPFG
jgi:hypothetical protein